MFDDAPLTPGLVRRVLREVWDLDVDALDYERVGYGGYHWGATCGGVRWFVTADRTDPGQPIVEAYELARRLADDGLDFVRAPLRHTRSGVTHAVDGFWLSVWPWLEGRASTWGAPVSAADVRATLRSVRCLHDHSGPERVGALVEDWQVQGRARLTEFMSSLGGFLGSGPYAEEVRDRVRARAGAIERLHHRYDELVSAVSPSRDLVLTHGEPHAANVVHTTAGAMLIDWDTVRWAPRERDLWMLVGQTGWRAAYGEADVSEQALDLYRLRWTLTEIALFVPDLAEAPARTPDREVALAELRDYLDGLPDGGR